MKNASHLEGPPLLEVIDLRVRIPTARGLVRAVDGVSFALGQGTTLAIVGESGCGKTVLCRAIMGLLPASAQVPAQSQVRFAGRNLRTLKEKALNRIRGREIAMVLQDPMSALNPVMKVGTQIAESLVHHFGMTRRRARQRAVELLRSVGIAAPQERAGCYPHQLCGGLRQRVAIAAALACEPRILIADEPTTALDVTVQAEILELLGCLQQERNMAVILVTHDLLVAAQRAHEIAVMYAGKIVEQAPAAQLLGAMRMPYTRALADAIPHLENPPHTRLHSINGRPPDLIQPPPGCRFAPRCKAAGEHCQIAEPPLSDPGPDGHCFACWHPLEAAWA